MRIGLVIAGLVALACAWLGPLPQLAQQAFFAHMLMHMLVVAVAAPLVALAMAGSRFDPVDGLPWFYAPVPASIGELILVWAWHAPALHHLARIDLLGLIAEQTTFLMAGLWVWLSAFGGRSPDRGDRRGAGVIGLLLTSMHMTFLGALLALAPRSVYDHHQEFAGMTALQDQHLGGAVMILVGGVAYLTGGLWLTVGMLRNRSPLAEAT